MNESEYLQQRLEDQITWYSEKSTSCQWRYKVSRIIEIVSAAIIPFLSGMGDKIAYGSWIIGFLGVAIAITASIAALFKFHENWIQFRATAETLKHEKFLFLAQTSPYTDDGRFHILVQRIEGLISNENSTWTQTFKSESKLPGKA